MGCACPATFCSALLSNFHVDWWQWKLRVTPSCVAPAHCNSTRTKRCLRVCVQWRAAGGHYSRGQTVRLSRHLANAANSGAIELDECCRVVSEDWVNQIVCADTELLVSSRGGGVQLCGVDGSRIGAPIAQPQLGEETIQCGCRMQNSRRILLQLKFVVNSQHKNSVGIGITCNIYG